MILAVNECRWAREQPGHCPMKVRGVAPARDSAIEGMAPTVLPAVQSVDRRVSGGYSPEAQSSVRQSEMVSVPSS